MSGIGPKAEVDEHALLGFDPSLASRQQGERELEGRLRTAFPVAVKIR
jgi:hypothetical protein